MWYKKWEYKQQHDSVGNIKIWQFCEKLGFNRSRLWYKNQPESVVVNENFKILWNFTIQYDDMIEARNPDIVEVDKVKQETMIIDVAIPGDTRVCDNEWEKITKYSFLKDKIARLWHVKKDCCNSHCSWSIRSYNNKFWEISWKPWN